MILIFGGTTEGRICAKVCEEAGKRFYYSTKSAHQKIELHNGIRVTGGMTSAEMVEFIQEKQIKLIVDAAHPFAEHLHDNISKASKQTQIPVVRYERVFPQADPRLIWLDTYEDAIAYLEFHKIDYLLGLTGVNTIAKLKPYWEKHTTWFRILDRDDSRELAQASGYPLNQLRYYESGADEKEILKELNPQAIITKESGDTGGFQEKVDAALALNIPLLVVKRPILDLSFITVHGTYGLRRTIEGLLPDFFELRIGYTTGSSATAATKAALLAILSQEKPTEIIITLPSGEPIIIQTNVLELSKDKATVGVIKDAGDDPDVTHGKQIRSSVQLTLAHEEIRFLQGKGVGRITLPGLDIPIGEPAINKTPRAMMCSEVEMLLKEFYNAQTKIGVDITISVPEGEELALKTFNPKLGIVGGISIIGTSGVVKPFSSEAFIGSIRREMQVAKALGADHVVINSGAKSEKYLKAYYPTFIPNAFVQYGNFIGEAIEAASNLDIPQVTLGVMIGKAVKLAEGNLDTHSKKVVMNKAFIQEIAQISGYSNEVFEKIEEMNLARQLWEIIPQDDLSFFDLLIEKCYNVCKPLFPNGVLKVILITESGRCLDGISH